MAVSVDAEFRDGLYHVNGAHYPFVKDVQSSWTPQSGLLLQRGPGFPVKYETPRVSFKIYKSICDSGLKPLVDKTLEKRRRSRITPNYIWNNVQEFSHKRPNRTDLRAYYRALDKLENHWNLDEKLHPLTFEEAAKRIPQSMSPGLPYIWTHPGASIDDIINSHLEDIKREWDKARSRSKLFPDCAAFARGHIGEPTDNKVIPEWAVPLSIILQEARFSSLITDELIQQRCCLNTAYGCEIMKGGMMWLNNQIGIANKRFGVTKILLTDYSGFDSSIPKWLIRDVFTIIKKKFVLTPEDEFNFKRIVNYFIHTPIQNSDGRRFKKSHGIPSGSMFTDIIGTMVNMVCSWTAADLVFGMQPVMDIYFRDDGFMCLPTAAILDLDKFAECMMDLFGLEVNLKKSYWTDVVSNVHFLGYYNYHGTPFKDPIDIIAAMLFPQHLHDDWEYCISRTLGCLLASAGCSTDVFQAARAVYNRSVRVGADIEEGIRLIRENPRSLRDLQTLDASDLHITSKFFFDINLSVPIASCTKLKLGVNVVSPLSVDAHSQQPKPCSVSLDVP